MNTQFAIICNPENRRLEFFKQAVPNAPFVISYIDLLRGNIDLDTILSKTDYLKIDSFGENFEVTKGLLALGTDKSPFISKYDALQLPFDKGRIQHSKQQYIGFCKLLDSIQNRIGKFPKLQVMNSVESIKMMFDKTTTHQFLKDKNIPIIPAIYFISSFDDLLIKMNNNNWKSVFIKPNYGSSASGVIAFRIRGDKMQATTSVFVKKDNGKMKLYNSLKVQTYTDKETIKEIVNILSKNDLIVEKWIPKANNKDGFYDFRIHTVGAKVKQIVVRQSKLPLTNLHLGNKRGDLAKVQVDMGVKNWNNLCQLAEKTARMFPNSLYVGLDLLLSKNYKKQYIIEANAFGDLLPNVLADGENTYETQINSLIKQ